jgi:hypothetical protein
MSCCNRCKRKLTHIVALTLVTMTGHTGTITPGTMENPGRGAATGKKSIAGNLHGNVPMHVKGANIGPGGTRTGSIEFGSSHGGRRLRMAAN